MQRKNGQGELPTPGVGILLVDFAMGERGLGRLCSELTKVLASPNPTFLYCKTGGITYLPDGVL